ncbi:solute carrier family 35, member F1/2 [Trypanosoma conorhini]|uniref:Solute carrier family 35, member F1/2 n=1 Tax=Trypanosoma conorhini TaxID=83891 RepID=A0A422PLN2_9TRYP|nr:solute carrier family 35, member F1/2 [Trypanosoma conorhini]RNF18624.1 solute carrier family 35, member F1/2 [Trypanosoma conorhini]
MKGKELRRLALHVLFGQAVAFLNSVTGVTTTKLVSHNASYPLLQSLTAYAFIFVVYAPLLLLLQLRHRQRKFSNFTFFYRPWRYALLAIIDLEANFVIVKAYQYTDMISVQLLSCFNIPCVLVLSFFVLKMRFALSHILGCVVATGGLALLIVLDADGVSRDTVGPNVAKGDLLCLLAAALYATSNVLTEWFIKPRPSHARIEHAEDAGVNQVAEVFRAPASPGVSSPCELRQKEERSGSPTAPNTMRLVESRREEDQGQLAEGEEESLPAVPMYIPLVENLGCMSSCALVFATIQFFALEWSSFAPARKVWTNEDWLYQMMFGLSMLFVYTGLPLLFLLASAAFANVSLLSVSVYSIIWNVTIFNIYPTPVFFASYVIIVLGVVLYDLSNVRWSWCPRINYPCGDPREGCGVPVQTSDAAPGHRELEAVCEVDVAPDAGITNNRNHWADRP